MDIQTLATNYQPDDSVRAILSQAQILLLVGISGAGKDTIQSHLLENTDYHKIVTHTTRPPRENNGVMEQNGREYHFVSQAELASLLSRRAMIEVNQYGDNYYSTSIDEFKTSSELGKIAVSNIDVNGVAALRRLAGDAVHALFIVPPDYDTWQSRLQKRYATSSGSTEKLAARYEEAKHELAHALSVPYYHFIINDDLERAVRVVDEIAHRRDSFNSHDDEARAVARTLLEAIKSSI